MKNTLFFCFIILCFSPSYAQTPSVSADEEAIKKVALASTDAYVNRDFNTYINLYVDAPTTTSIVTPNNYPGLVVSTTDFQKISKGSKTWFEASPQSEMKVEKRDNFIIRINGNMAWIIYDQNNVMVKSGAKIKSKEFRVLEKRNGDWKISATSAIWNFAKTEYSTPNPEEEDIKKLISDEGKAFGQGNIDAFMNTQADVPYLLWTVTNLGDPGDVLTYRGAKALKEFAMSLPWFKNFKPEIAQKPVPEPMRDNWSFQFRGNIVMVNFDEHIINDQAKTKVSGTVLKILERINGQWKLITTTALADFKDATPPIKSKY